MPNKQNKRSRRSKPRRPGPVVTGTSGLAGAFPNRHTCLMNYADIYSLQEAAAGVGVFQVNRMGDVYDPDYTGLGHQPMFFDQLCTSVGPYLLHTTKKCDIHMRFINISTVPALIVAYFSSTATNPVSRTQAQERSYAFKHVIPPTGTGGAAFEHRLSIDNPKFIGIDPKTYEASYSGNYGSAASCPYLIVAVYGYGGIANLVLSMNLVYTTTFYQLGQQTSS